jgi:hypothetical protein
VCKDYQVGEKQKNKQNNLESPDYGEWEMAWS